MNSEYAFYVIAVIALLIFASVIILGYGQNRSANNVQPAPKQLGTITITATGTVYNSSSQALVYIIVNGTGLTNQQAVQNVSTTLETFNSTISPYVNGNLSRITTTNFNVYKLYNRTGYQATESLSILIPNIKNVSPAIGDLSGITNVYVTDARPRLSDAQVSLMRNVALSDAMANATSQARSLIGANNTVTMTNITVNNYYIYPVVYSLGAVAQGSVVSRNTTIPPQFYGGLNRVTESVTVMFTYGPVSQSS